MAPVGVTAARTLFFLLLAGGALLFGGVDRPVQAGLLAGLGAGLALAPPGRFGALGWVWLGALLFVALKEFLPADWLGEPGWRERLREGFRVAFPPTRSAELGRAADALWLLAVAGLFAFWVRGLAEDAGGRAALAWGGMAAVFAVAAVSLFAPGNGPEGIYGVRPTAGWTGFGPFPNRNHTACFLAMGVPVGCGLAARSAVRRRWWGAAGGLLAAAVAMAAVFESRSRGGALAMFAGLAVFGLLAALRVKGARGWALAASLAALGGTGALELGGDSFSRFFSETEGGVSSRLRAEIWRDGLAMWGDAPWLGHGFGAFAGAFPMYQRVELESQYVLHPESSWLKWGIEGGALWVLLLAGLVFAGAVLGAARALSRQRGFWVRAGALGGVAALACHGLIDVPAHRWPVAGLGLAMMAVALSDERGRAKPRGASRAWCAVPLAAALFWATPAILPGGAWSVGGLQELRRRIAREPDRVRYSEAAAALARFPLDVDLHHFVGMRLLPLPGRAGAAAGHFRVADRLRPASWWLPSEQGRACAVHAPEYAAHFWGLAVDRAGHRAEEVYLMAAKETAGLPGAAAFWEQYAAARPELLLTRALHGGGAAEEYRRWMEERGGSADLETFEIRNLYALMERHGSPEDLGRWRAARPGLEASDHRAWARLYRGWGEDREAWDLLARWVKEPVPPKVGEGGMAQAKKRWLLDPSDFLSAQQLVGGLVARGDVAGAEDVVAAVVRREDAPAWFLRRAAYGAARRGEFAAAADLVLREGVR